MINLWWYYRRHTAQPCRITSCHRLVTVMFKVYNVESVNTDLGQVGLSHACVRLSTSHDSLACGGSDGGIRRVDVGARTATVATLVAEIFTTEPKNGPV